MPTHEEIEALVLREAQRVCGSFVTLTEVEGFRDGDIVSFRDLTPPVTARVLESRSTVIRWTDDSWCDPVYPVELVDPSPQIAQLEAPFVYGTAWSVDGNCEPATFTAAAAAAADVACAGEDGPTEEARPQPAPLM